MRRIIDGVVFEGKPSPDRYYATLVDLGNGHREACVSRAVDWVDAGPMPLHWCATPLDPAEQARADARAEEEAEERKQANLKRAARRAKTAVRRRCKALGLDNLLTLTYRGNQTDQALCEVHLKEFLRAMRSAYRAIGIEDFAYVGCFEPQKRGAWHVHLAVHRVPRMLQARNGVRVKSWNVIRAIWRRVVGDWGGNIDLARARTNAAKSAAKVANYISKYVLKMFEAGEDHSKRFRASRCDVPKGIRLEYVGRHLLDIVAEVCTHFAFDGARVAASVWASPFGDVFYVAGENPS